MGEPLGKAHGIFRWLRGGASLGQANGKPMGCAAGSAMDQPMDNIPWKGPWESTAHGVHHRKPDGLPVPWTTSWHG